MLNAHRAFNPHNDHLMKDIMTAKERQVVTAPVIPVQIKPRDDKDRASQEFSQNLDMMFQQYDNPVIDRT